jgi:PAS domain S-box-containing protein
MFRVGRLKSTFRRQLLLYVALPLAYVICGRLGLLLAVPPGFATPVFLPAGIAVTAMFIAGSASLPGTFLGSFLLNVWISYSIKHQLDVVGVNAALIIALSSTIQVAAGGALLRKLIGYPAFFDNLRDLLLLLLLAPVICLISATLSLIGLRALAIVPATDLIGNWITWWVGDTLGVLVALPLMLVLVGEPQPLWRSRTRFVAVPMVLCFAVFVTIFMHVNRWESDQSLSQFRWAVLAAGALGTGLLGGLLLLGTGHAYRLEKLAKQLGESGERFRKVVESVPNAIVMVSPKGLIEIVNAQTERMFGYSRNDLLGKPVEMLLPERYRPNHPGLRTEFFVTPVSRPMGAGRDLYALRRDGGEFPVEIGLNPIETEQGAMVLAALIDISDRRRTEERIHSVNTMLAHMNRIATAGELSSSIAHEIKQPLAAVTAHANAGLRWLTKETPDIDEALAALRAIVKDGQRVGEVIESVRAMYKKTNQERVPVDLDNLVQSILGLVRAELWKQQIIIQTELTKPLPLVIGHKGQLQQVILNLIRNAAEAMQLVSGRARILRVKTAPQDPDRVLLSIADSGTGIDPEDIDRIFEAFYTTKAEGMGMGLAICRSIIEVHGGQLWASSGVDHGSVFNILLPAIGP